MTMYYDDRDYRILQEKMARQVYEGSVLEQRKILDQQQRARNSAALRKKAIPARKPAHA